jgi:hypothetical protein
VIGTRNARAPWVSGWAGPSVREAEVVAEIDRSGGCERLVGFGEVAAGSVEVDVLAVPRGGGKPGEHRRCALEHPLVWIYSEHPCEQAVVGEPSLEIPHGGARSLRGDGAQPVGNRLPQRLRSGVATFGHAECASVRIDSRSA